MNFILTVCSNSYLAQAAILGNSIRQYEPSFKYIIFLCDRKVAGIDYSKLADEVIAISEIEPDIWPLAAKYNIIELNTAVKPTAIRYLFEKRNAQRVIYLDPDTKLFAPLSSVHDDLERFSIVLTPHIYEPIPFDGKGPGENIFLNYGLYNLGFIALKAGEQTISLLKWWKEWTYHAGFDKVENGYFVDQLPMNLVPIFFDEVKVSEDIGLNMAPWNLHERQLSKRNGRYLVNGRYPLVFYHFSSFLVNSNELPKHKYNRFSLLERPDLMTLYADYNNEMLANSCLFYASFKSVYTTYRERFLRRQQRPERLSLVRKIKRMLSSGQ